MITSGTIKQITGRWWEVGIDGLPYVLSHLLRYFVQPSDHVLERCHQRSLEQTKMQTHAALIPPSYGPGSLSST